MSTGVDVHLHHQTSTARACLHLLCPLASLGVLWFPSLPGPQQGLVGLYPLSFLWHLWDLQDPQSLWKHGRETSSVGFLSCSAYKQSPLPGICVIHEALLPGSKKGGSLIRTYIYQMDDTKGRQQVTDDLIMCGYPGEHTVKPH